ncbi:MULTISPECIES: hypothetical protein [unclassified Corynebacterium]|jgi:hypothetical protein|uniref:hypothetical protein n=1 Tax=Corynebacterium TaxID=1716 RepID=UPI00255098BF|nr:MULTISPECIES: hypothetical protein [unclassified Corynebacterium]MDK8453590.1 hypothetical protein [Corynebacterium sp. MSK084]MDK8468054.1 hypothetical protein [Corynebacterium sp. MSK130]MDK8476373.1 hypothetical protein [Corynebacterium sp. MSK310]MDK8491713.1 hypothetical protein [Corynebacterium sp. MSK175]MDK8515520.1 hypothetical protein [Corynebacterium sp. MSK123]
MKAAILFFGAFSAALVVVLLPRCFDDPSSLEIGAIAFFSLLSVGFLMLARAMSAERSGRK